MGSLTTWFGWKVSDTINDELPDIFPLAITREDFVRTDVINIYKKILTDVVERISGLSDDQSELLWDNCLQSSSDDGLLTMLAQAMTDKRDLFLVYDRAIGVIRKADHSEESQIREDYKAQSQSPLGIYISFKKYSRTDMIRLYSMLEYSTISSLNKAMNLSTAIQFKMDSLRSSVALTDSDEAKAQAKLIAKGLANGKDILIDAKDTIENSKPDLTSVKAAIEFLDSKRSFYLGLPLSYINGELTGGIGSTGENDTKATERGLKHYYFSVIKPVLEAIFQVQLSYKSQDFRQISQALDAIRTFEIVGDDLIDQFHKKRIVSGLLDIELESGE